MESQTKVNVSLYDVKKLNECIDHIADNIDFNDIDYKSSKELVECVESLRASLITLDQLQKCIKEQNKVGEVKE